MVCLLTEVRDLLAKSGKGIAAERISENETAGPGI